jgi:hypothetical protein
MDFVFWQVICVPKKKVCSFLYTHINLVDCVSPDDVGESGFQQAIRVQVYVCSHCANEEEGKLVINQEKSKLYFKEAKKFSQLSAPSKLQVGSAVFICVEIFSSSNVYRWEGGGSPSTS